MSVETLMHSCTAPRFFFRCQKIDRVLISDISFQDLYVIGLQHDLPLNDTLWFICKSCLLEFFLWWFIVFWDVMLCSLAEEIPLTRKKKAADSSKICVSTILHCMTVIFAVTAVRTSALRFFSLHTVSKGQRILALHSHISFAPFSTTSSQSFFIALSTPCQGVKTLWVFWRTVLPSSLLTS